MTCAEKKRERASIKKKKSGLWSKVRHLRRREKTEGGDEERWRGIETDRGREV